jgi:hypothetical protein
METKEREAETWSEYRRMVLKTMDDMHEQLTALNKDLAELKTTVTVIKTQAAMVGVIISLVASFITTIIVNALLK